MTSLCSAATPTSVTRVLSTPCAADLTGQYVRRLLEPAFCSVPTAVEIPALFQSALRISGTLPFPVPDVFYESQRRQDGDMKHYLAPVSQSAAVKFSSKLHDVLTKSFPAGTEMVQAGLFLAYIFRICFLVFWGCGVQYAWPSFVLCHWFRIGSCGMSALCCQIHAKDKRCWHAGHFDQLVCEMLELLDQYAGRLNLKRKRNEGKASLTLTAKRPDLCLLVRDALLFKGEDKTDESNLNQAVAELQRKMRRWSQSYHGKVICHCAFAISLVPLQRYCH